jgi:hypothetical protein
MFFRFVCPLVTDQDADGKAESDFVLGKTSGVILSFDNRFGQSRRGFPATGDARLAVAVKRS